MLAATIAGRYLPHAAIRTAWRQQVAGPLKGTQACACAALLGSVLHRVECSIYSRRPRACREAVRRGDEACVSVRRMFEQLLQDEGLTR